jgi:hypothetical protein
MNRNYIQELLKDYDIQIYLEDDIDFKNHNLEYWLNYKDKCIENDYNLGFLRYEVDVSSGKLLSSDLFEKPTRVIKIDNQSFLFNDINPYYGFWIYDRSELTKFVESKYWQPDPLVYDGKDIYGTREISAIGWHGLNMTRYKGTVLPLQETGAGLHVVHPDCQVHHLPNNYIGHPLFCKVEFPIQV